MADVAAQIDEYLRKQGSPLTGLGNVFVAAGRKYGVDPRLTVAISGAESSFGKHLLGANNAWGWGPGRPFSSFEEGISTVTRGLRSGYIDQGLKTPAAISSKWAPVGADNDPHGLNQNWTDNVSHFYEQLGGAPGVSSVAKANTSAFPTAPPKARALPAAFDPSPIIETGFGLSPQMNVRRVVDAMVAYDRRPQPQATSAGRIPRASDPLVPRSKGKPGMPVAMVTSVGGLHETSGLAGYPAHDYMAPAGTPVIAPVGGRVFKLSGHDPANGPTSGPHGPFGWSLYIRGNDGRNYFLTHLGSRHVRLGQVVRAGQPIGTVGNYAHWGGANHVHMGVNG